MACSCGKSDRARLYCRRMDCGTQPALLGEADARVKFNRTHGELSRYAPLMRMLADSAYAASADDLSPGPRRAMLRIAELASNLATELEAGRPL